jgi:hypothetical protein
VNFLRRNKANKKRTRYYNTILNKKIFFFEILLAVFLVNRNAQQDTTKMENLERSLVALRIFAA